MRSNAMVVFLTDNLKFDTKPLSYYKTIKNPKFMEYTIPILWAFSYSFNLELLVEFWHWHLLDMLHFINGMLHLDTLFYLKTKMSNKTNCAGVFGTVSQSLFHCKETAKWEQLRTGTLRHRPTLKYNKNELTVMAIIACIETMKNKSWQGLNINKIIILKAPVPITH